MCSDLIDTLHQIFLPAIVGLVPDRVVECVREFLDFCYIARRSSHDRTSLQQMEGHLHRFQELRDVFRDENIRDGFTLPRQHALSHFVRGIKLFGSPNGLCTSITDHHLRQTLSSCIIATRSPHTQISCF